MIYLNYCFFYVHRGNTITKRKRRLKVLTFFTVCKYFVFCLNFVMFFLHCHFLNPIHVHYPHLYKSFTLLIIKFWCVYDICHFQFWLQESSRLSFCHWQWATTINGNLNSLICYPIDKFKKMKLMSMSGHKIISPEAVAHYNCNFKGCLILLIN